MRSTSITKIKEVLESTITFAVVTTILVAIISFCIVGTVISQSDIGAQEMECYYREQEQVLLQEMRERLVELGYFNSGVTLTRVVDAEGQRDYTFTIHHGKIDKMSEAAREELGQMLLETVVIDENCIFYHEFLLYE